jgi:molecular chaperone HtpG
VSSVISVDGLEARIQRDGHERTVETPSAGSPSQQSQGACGLPHNHQHSGHWSATHPVLSFRHLIEGRVVERNHMTEQVEQLEFQAEARQLLDLLVHSVYSNKDSFLRELISNASDALDKLRLEAFRNKDLDVDTSDLHIEIETDKGARTLTVRDDGIGMTREEVVGLIGTLAKSGTAELRQQLREAKNAAASEELIGQFGIGFYSTFMVADKVELLTRKAGESDATRWASSGEGTYTIESVEDAPQGTSVKLHLKPEDPEDELHDYTSEPKIRALVKQYSDFIAWPIRMAVERRSPAAEDDGDDVVTVETETINSMKALWARPKGEVSDEEYKEFYKHVAHAWDDPLEVIAMKAEGTFEYQALLFIPTHAPFDLFNHDSKVGVALYVKRVFIMSDCDQLMPPYLRFVKGVVDAQDMSLNVSREILQQDRQIKAIRRRLTKKVLSTIKGMQSERQENYHTFWTQFGAVLKEGLLSDVENQETLLGVSSFASTHSEEEPTTLAEYVERMKDGQEQIFYATGESRQLLLNSPHLEAFKAKGYEVLLLTDPVDEIWVGVVTEFDGKPLQSVARGEVDLDSEDDKTAHEAQRQEQERDFADLLTWLMETLSDHVKEVRLSTRLTESPACLITDAFGITPALARMYRASGQAVPVGKRILELNPNHPLITGLQQACKDRGDDSSLVDTAELLYGTALLAEGGALEDPAKFAGLLADRLTRTL